MLRDAAAAGVPVAFYGSSDQTLAALAAQLPSLAPGLDVRAMVSPPYRALTAAEDADYTAELVASGARVLFVGLGCPRQERWCADHRGRVPAVMLAVGAAFAAAVATPGLAATEAGAAAVPHGTTGTHSPAGTSTEPTDAGAPAPEPAAPKTPTGPHGPDPASGPAPEAPVTPSEPTAVAPVLPPVPAGHGAGGAGAGGGH